MIELKEKDLNELLENIKTQISEEKLVTLKYLFEQINEKYNSEKKILKTNEEIKFKINSLKSFQNKEDILFYIEFIPILMIACEIKFGMKPRNIQILSLLLFLLKNKTEGIIEQIQTGEGKSLIITFLATIKAFSGKKVDILTSSPVLAERDAKKMTDFYAIFDIKADYCREIKNNEVKGVYPYYEADICYGNELSFEGDILRSEFLGLTGRGTRKFDCIIIDEIDNICLDNIKNMTELMDNFKGYRYLEYFYIYIFNELLEIERKELIGFNNAYKKEHKKEIIEKLYTNVIKNIYKIPSFIKIQKYILDNYVKYKIKKWCELAFEANFCYFKNKDYIIVKDEELNYKIIKPIDYANTGIIEENTIWSGLHQFLQIKEHLRLTEENLNSCYMSNLTFFKKYIKFLNNEKINSEIMENNIYGLTGTLGSIKSQNALKNIYNLNLIFIPSHKKNQLIIKEPKIFSCYLDHKKELKEIIKDISIKQKRAVLVLLKFIDNVEKLKIYLSEDNDLKNNIITYTRSDINSEKEFLHNEIQPQSIILSTNLAGRGTDLKISKEVEKNGGLHVILTFIPKSERIEKQAFGRAARKGEKGSAQYIICSNDKNLSIDELFAQRDKDELNEYKYLIDVYQKKVFLFEKFFRIFSNKLKLIRETKIKNENNKESILEDIKERWALFLVQNDLSNIEKNYKDEQSLNYSENEFEKTEKNFEVFMAQLEKDTISLDDYIFVNKLLCFDLSDYNYNELIQISPIGAYINIICSEFFQKEKDHKKKIADYFTKLLNECNSLKNQANFLYNNFHNIAMKDSELEKQFLDKKEYINMIINKARENKEILEKKRKKNITLEISNILNLDEFKKFTRDIYLYYYDLGIFFFNLKIQEENKSSFIKSIFDFFK